MSDGGRRKYPGREIDPAEILSGTSPDSEPAPPGHRSGFAVLVGRPNVGKSTLLNQILGQKLAITTRKPGTTRRRLLGVHTTPQGQAVFLDTPGLERPDSKLGRFLLEEVKAAFSSADVVLFITDAQDEPADIQALELLGDTGTPFFLVLNKVDLMKDKKKLLPLIERYSRIGGFEEFFPVSALKGTNVDRLLSALIARLPEGPRHFSSDTITDASERTLVEEFVREQVYRQLHKEVPYAVAVQVSEMERDPESDRLHIEASIYVERKSQRGIVIGRGGERLKSIGQAARLEIEKRFGEEVYLGLHVRVKPNWRQRDGALHDLGYTTDS
ncbi:MAG: GTPase Era [bacterium]